MRGKHASSSALRREVAAHETDVATYQRAVVRLTAERNSLKEKLEAEQLRHRKAERELRARLDEAAAPKVAALEMVVSAEREKNRKSKLLVEALTVNALDVLGLVLDDLRAESGIALPENVAVRVLEKWTSAVGDRVSADIDLRGVVNRVLVTKGLNSARTARR